MTFRSAHGHARHAGEQASRDQSRRELPMSALRSLRRPVGLALSGLAALFFLLDATGKLLQVDQVMRGTAELGWPTTAVIPLGVLLLVGTALYVIPRTSVLGAIYLTGFLGGAIATHYRVGSPLATHVLFGIYVAMVMWAGLLLRYPALLGAIFRGPGAGFANALAPGELAGR